LFKPSIWFKEDILALTLGFSLGEDGPVLLLRTPSGKGGMAPASEADPGTPARPMDQDREPGGEIAAIIGLPYPDVDW
jgi:hypothetical protein